MAPNGLKTLLDTSKTRGDHGGSPIPGFSPGNQQALRTRDATLAYRVINRPPATRYPLFLRSASCVTVAAKLGRLRAADFTGMR